MLAEGQWESLFQQIGSCWHWPQLWYLVMAITMVPVNLGLETIKFRLLTRQFLPMGFSELFRSVLGGSAVAFVTPNRVGEYAGRVLFLKKKYSWQAVAATVVGSLSQLLAILIFGLVGTLVYYTGWLEDNGLSSMLITFFGGSLVLFTMAFYYNIDLLLPFLRRIPLGKAYLRILSKLTFLKHYTFGQLSLILLAAVGRFIVYCTQYVLLLWFFGLEEKYLRAMAAIAMIFLLQTSLPLPPLAGLIAKGELAMLVFGHESPHTHATVLSATFLLFFVNVAMPALVGLLLIWQVNLRQTLGITLRR